MKTPPRETFTRKQENYREVSNTKLILGFAVIVSLIFLLSFTGYNVVNSEQILFGDGITGAAVGVSDLEVPEMGDEASISLPVEEPIDEPEDELIIEAVPSNNLGKQESEATATSCGYVNSDLTLTADVTNETTCFTINNSNLTLDCAGYMVTYATGEVHGSGVANSYNNVTIKNCNIVQGGASQGEKGIYLFGGAENVNITNNNITTTGVLSYGVRCNNVNGTITNNNITTAGSTACGIITYYSSVNISYNNITLNDGPGIDIDDGSSNLTVSFNTIDVGDYGIRLRGGSSNINITSNDIDQDSSYDGVYIAESSNNTVINSNNITCSGSSGDGIYSENSDGAILTSNNITTGRYGIYFTGSSNSALNSNVISSFTGWAASAIYFLSNSDSNNITNNNITTNGHGVQISSSNSTFLTNNIVNISGSTANQHGIYLTTSSYSNMTGNTINTSDGFPIFVEDTGSIDYCNHTVDTTNTGNGKTIYYYFDNDSITIEDQDNVHLYIMGSNNVTINNVTLENYGLVLMASNNVTIENSSISGSVYYGIYGSYLNDSKIVNNNVSNINGKVIYLYASSGLNITGNTISDNGRGYYAGIYFEDTNGSTIVGNNFTNNDFATVYIYNSYSNSFENNYFSGNTRAYDLYGFNNNFTNEEITGHTQGIYISEYSSSGNVFRDSNFSSNTYDLYATFSGSDLSFVNCSINKSTFNVGTDVRAYIKWYVDVNVTDSGLNALENTTCQAYDVINSLTDTRITNSEGVCRLDVTEFYHEGSLDYYVTPATIRANKGNYTENSSSVDLYNETYNSTNLSLTAVDCGSTFNTDFSLGNNYECGNLGLIAGADGVTINGNSFNLTGNGSGTGIELNGRNNISINNINVSNFTIGINFRNTNNSNASTVEIRNNTYGVMFNNSGGSQVSDSILDDNSGASVFATNTGETNNSLINVTVDIDNISVSGSASVLVKWYVDVKANYTDVNGNSNYLSGANATGYFNNTVTKDYSLSTDSNGLARLILTESKKTSSGTTYLTPHNVTLSFTGSTLNISNFTYVNLTQTNNTAVNLSGTLNCTSPYTNMNVSSNTTFCPGTFDIDGFNINESEVTLTCEDTIIRGQGIRFSTINIVNVNNTTIIGCKIEDTHIIIYEAGSVNISNVNYSSQTIYSGLQATYHAFACYRSNNSYLENSYLSSYSCLFLKSCSNWLISNNTFDCSRDALWLYLNSDSNVIRSNTFQNSASALLFRGSSTANPATNDIYYNNFTGNNINIGSTITNSSFIQNFNTSVAVGYGQGNEYDDYCDKGVDLNNDSYADNVSSNTTVDWPYNATVSSKISERSTAAGVVVDYGPKITTCPAQEVFLGDTTTRGGVVSPVPAVVPVPAVEPEPLGKVEKEEPIELYSVENTRKFLKKEKIETKRVSKDTFQIVVALENTGTKTMQLFPEIFSEVDDPFFIVTRKTLGFEGSLLNKLASLTYSKNVITGRLLQAKIVNPEQIILAPGEKIEKVLEISEGLAVPRQLKIQFTTFGETVFEHDVEMKEKALSGTAVDVDSANNLIDLYAVIFPAQLSRKLELERRYKEQANQELTGGAVLDLVQNNEYYLEVSMNKLGSRQTAFADLYGPYRIPAEQALIFAQQLKYDPEVYTGDYVVRTKVYKGNAVVVENEFEISLEKEISEEWIPLEYAPRRGFNFAGKAAELTLAVKEKVGIWIVPIIALLLVVVGVVILLIIRKRKIS